MVHPTDIWFVNAHSECIRANNDAQVSVGPCFQSLSAGICIQPGVVGLHTAMDPFETRRPFFGLIARSYVNQPRACCIENRLMQHGLGIPNAAHCIREVVASRRCAENGRVLQFKVSSDVFDYTLRGRSRETPPRRLGKRLPNKCKVAVSWSKIVPPLGDAMGFVHRYGANIEPLQPCSHQLALQFFRRCKQKARRTTFGIVEDAFQRTRI